MSLFNVAGQFLGGIGLFLAGMWLMTDGLKLAAGSALRNVLGYWTNSRERGLLGGFALTALVQSSSAVTVATIGFANAGLLTLERSMWVIFGSNVGTTMTGWIVALVGFRLDVSAFALPMVGVGMILRLTGERQRRGAVGQALLGFGLLFLGIDGLKHAFDALGTSYSLPSVAGGGVHVALLYVAIGFMLTTLMQSSSAALVITLTAAEGGLIGLYAAAATVIGANLGTTTTAVLAVWGATPTARRVAASHVAFNLMTAAVATLVLVPLLALVGWLERVLDLPSAPATSLAVFHTVFNLLGVVLMWPLSGRLVTVLSGWFRTREEDAAQPRYLDRNALSVPEVASSALLAELERLLGMTRSALRVVLSGDGASKDVRAERHAIRQIAAAVATFCAELSRTSLPAPVAAALPNMLRIAQHCVTAADLMDEEHVRALNRRQDAQAPLGSSLQAFRRACAVTLEELASLSEKSASAALTEALALADARYEDLKTALLESGARGALSPTDMETLLAGARSLHRATTHTARGARRMAQAHTVDSPEGAPAEASPAGALEPDRE